MRNVPVWLFLAALSLPARATAQQSGPASEQPFRKWDAGGSFGIRFGSGDDAVVPAGGWSVEAGRYWTAHIKTSVGVARTGDSVYESSGISPNEYRLTETIPHPAALAGSVSYQFYENVFAHPYLTA